MSVFEDRESGSGAAVGVGSVGSPDGTVSPATLLAAVARWTPVLEDPRAAAVIKLIAVGAGNGNINVTLSGAGPYCGFHVPGLGQSSDMITLTSSCAGGASSDADPTNTLVHELGHALGFTSGADGVLSRASMTIAQ